MAQVPASSRGVPSSGGTFTGAVAVSPTDAAASDIATINAPTNYVNSSPTGYLLRITAAGINVFYVDAYGELTLKAPAGQGNPSIALSSVDNASAAVRVDPGQLNLTDAAANNWLSVSAAQFLTTATTLGFYGATAVAKQTITGAKLPSDIVLARLLTALAALGLITDSST